MYCHTVVVVSVCVGAAGASRFIYAWYCALFVSGEKFVCAIHLYLSRVKKAHPKVSCEKVASCYTL